MSTKKPTAPDDADGGWVTFEDPNKDLVQRAQRGDTTAAWEVLRAFCDSRFGKFRPADERIDKSWLQWSPGIRAYLLKRGAINPGKRPEVNPALSEVSPYLIGYVVECIGLALGGVPFKKAFGLSHGHAGRTKEPRLSKQAGLCIKVMEEKAKSSCTLEESRKRVASRENGNMGQAMGKGTVKAAWDNADANMVARAVLNLRKGQPPFTTFRPYPPLPPRYLTYFLKQRDTLKNRTIK